MFKLGFSDNYTTYQEFYTYVERFENGVLADSKLNSNDKSAILAGTSTARYSVYYWDNELGGKTQSNTPSKRGFWGHVLVAVCDAGGAVLGYLEGGVVSAISVGTSASNAAGDQIDKK